MALTVPTVSNPSVQTRALPGVRQDINASAASFGGTQARQAQQAGNDLMAAGDKLAPIAIKLQEQQTADEVFQADAALKTGYLEYQRQASQQTGSNAWGATDRAKNWFATEGAKYGENITSPRGKQLYLQSAQRLQLDATDYFGRFELDQRNKSLVASNEARVVSDVNLAAADPIEANVSKARRTIEQGADVTGQINGWTPEERKANVDKNLGLLHQQVLQGLIENDPTQAKTYLDAHKDEIPGTMQAELEKGVRVGTAKIDAQTFADQVMASGVNEAQARAMIREKYSGDEEDIYISAVNGRFAEKASALAEVERNAADEAWKVVAEGGDMSKVPTWALNGMDPRVRISMADYVERKAQGKAVKTDPTTYDQLNRLSASDPQAFRDTNMLQYVDKLSESDWQYFSNRQNDITKPDKVAEVATFEQQLGTRHDQLGLTGADPDGGKAAARGRFDKMAQDAVSAAQAEKGKALTLEERGKILDKLMAPGVVKGHVWGTNDVRAYEVIGTEKEGEFSATVPAEFKARVEASAARNKQAVPSDERIRQMYLNIYGLSDPASTE